MSALRDALRAAGWPDVVICMKCGEINPLPPASPTIELRQDGVYYCTVCSHAWKKEEAAC